MGDACRARRGSSRATRCGWGTRRGGWRSRETVSRAWRWRELGLMLLAALPSLAGVAVLSLVWERPLTDPRFRPIYGLLMVLLLGHVVLSVCRCRGDQLLLPLVTALAGIGLVLVTRLVPALGP